MFTVSKSIWVNPSPKQETVLTRDHIWEGLVMKAEDATPFVEVMDKCRVLERGDRYLRREIEINGTKAQERVTFFPKHMVVFEPLESDGLIKNDIEEDAHGHLSIRFTFALEVPKDENLSAQNYAQRMEKNYTAAVETTLATIRAFVKEGKL